MNKLPQIAAAVLLSFSGLVSAAENLAITGAGLSLPSVELPAPGAPKNNHWQTLSKIKLNTAAPEMNDRLVGLLDKSFDSYTAVRELTQAGLKVQAYQSNTGGYMVFADVTGQDAADWAIGLARYYYVTEVRVGQKVYDRLFPSRNKSTYAVKMGSIKGVMNNGPVNLKINKLDWTIKGGINNYPVDLGINHEQSVITGGANASTVGLKFDWSTEEITVLGNSGPALLRYTVNWKKGLLEGQYNHSPVKVEFDLGQGYADQTIVSLTGYAAYAPVELTFNKVNGHLGGYMNHAPVDINLVNCDIYDFLQHFFLFLK
ncbi:MAG: hypothetical protein A2179_06290 [Elusimicrobia bacterium GWC2_63_65]|nr:MAG: hypothetical protein A2179_06290 [Elusimicrobia bacterium GWC2_63_65]